MAAIKVSVASLIAAAHGLVGVSRVAERLQGRTRAQRGALATCGHEGLAQAGDDFLESWERGVRKVGEEAAALSSLLGDAARAYGYVESCIVSAASRDGDVQ